MLKSLELENYRCFSHHKIEFKNLSVAVGKNNAGKSTMVEALRLVSIVAGRNINFKEVPFWLELPTIYRGVSPSLNGLDFSTKNVFHKYQKGPAKITAIFNNESKIEIYIGEPYTGIEVFAVISDKNGNIKKNKNDKKIIIPDINILPQISAISKEEVVLNADTVKANISTQLSSNHFRNQIKYNYDYFIKFKELSERTWPGLGVEELDGRYNGRGEQLHLFVRDNDFTAELGWMGHGLQMWLQTMWFLSRADNNSTVILDEPDVYMHADLQRKLIRFLRKIYNQVIIATHSVEIISEVSSQDILIIDKSGETSSYASSVPAVQTLIEGFGSIHNIGLARLWSAKKLLLVEGNDVSILKRMQETIFLGNCEPFDTIPRASIGGWTGWQYVKGADLVLKNGLKQNLNVYCILDSDYHDVDEISERKKEAEKLGIKLHIWHQKEIENYLICPTAIYRIIARKRTNIKALTLNRIIKAIDEITEGMKEDYIDKIADQISSKNRNLQPSSINKTARDKVANLWNKKNEILSGKEILKKVNIWSNENFKTSITAVTLASELNYDEIPNEIKDVLNAIEANKDYNL